MYWLTTVCWLSLFHCFNEQFPWTWVSYNAHLIHVSSTHVNTFAVYCTYHTLSPNSLLLMLFVWRPCDTKLNLFHIILSCLSLSYSQKIMGYDFRSMGRKCCIKLYHNNLSLISHARSFLSFLKSVLSFWLAWQFMLLYCLLAISSLWKI